MLTETIDPTITMKHLGEILGKLKPKRVICQDRYLQVEKSIDGQVIKTQNIKSLVEGLGIGASISLSETDLEGLKYTGQCPTVIANQIKQKGKLFRVDSLGVQFQDN